MLQVIPSQDWLSIQSAAIFLERHPRTIQRMCVDGTLIAFSCKVYQDIRGRWYVLFPSTPHFSKHRRAQLARTTQEVDNSTSA